MKDRLFRSEAHVFDAEGKQVLFDVLGGRFFEVDSLTREVAEASGLQSVEAIVREFGGRYLPAEVASAVEELQQAEVLTREPVQIALFHPPSRLEITHLALCLTRDEAGQDGDGRAPGDRPPSLRAIRRGTEDSSEIEEVRTGLARTSGELRAPGGDRGKRSRSIYMSEAVGLSAVDFLIQSSGCLRDCEITFEGGEPLLNLPLLRRVISHAEERGGQAGKRMAFEVVTDGRLLTPRIASDFAAKGVQIALRVDGEGGLGHLRKAAAALKGYPSLTLQIGVARRVPPLRALTAELLRLFPSASALGIRWGAGLGPELLDDILAELSGLQRQAVEHLLNGGVVALEAFEGPVGQLLERQVLLYGCGAGSRSISVCPDGRLFPCLDMIDSPEFGAGDIFTGLDERKYAGWMQHLHVERRETCRSCWARYLCGGGCCADAVAATGGMDAPNPVSCSRIRRTYELAMALFVEVEDRSPGLLSARHLATPSESHKDLPADERPVLERYA